MDIVSMESIKLARKGGMQFDSEYLTNVFRPGTSSGAMGSTLQDSDMKSLGAFNFGMRNS